MSRYNLDHNVEPIYAAARQWLTRSFLEDHSVFRENKSLWTASLFDELDLRFVNGEYEGRALFLVRLKELLSKGSPDCKQLMSEILWLMLLFPSNITADKKRENVRESWSWAGEVLEEPHPFLEDAVLNGIGSTGSGYSSHRDWEICFIIGAFRDFKVRDAADREKIASDPWAFSSWLSGFLEAQEKRQLVHILPHLLFPDTFERSSTERDKRSILACFNNTPERDIQGWSTIEIDRALLKLRKRLEQKRGAEIDFYEEELEAQWKAQPSVTGAPVLKEGGTKTGEEAAKKAGTPLNLILYGPPGTGKTYCLMSDHLPKYRDNAGDRFEFVTFHQSYAYEDFVEGIRPVTEKGTVTYEVRPGVLKRLCDKARRAPDKRFALFIDEINRGNVAKVFGELITLVEMDKRIHTEASGNRLAGCKGLEVTLPYSEERFGVPANVDVIGTMNTADRSIALLDTALRRRFRFEELVPNPELLESIDDGEDNEIDLQQLLQTMNERLSRLLHRDQSLGHSYFYHVKSFDELRSIFAREILPFLQEAFYDDWRQIRYVLADQAVGAEFQLVRVRTQKVAELFPGMDPAEIDDGEAFEIIRENEITPEAIRKIYEPLE